MLQETLQLLLSLNLIFFTERASWLNFYVVLVRIKATEIILHFHGQSLSLGVCLEEIGEWRVRNIWLAFYRDGTNLISMPIVFNLAILASETLFQLPDFFRFPAFLSASIFLNYNASSIVIFCLLESRCFILIWSFHSE